LPDPGESAGGDKDENALWGPVTIT